MLRPVNPCGLVDLSLPLISLVALVALPLALGLLVVAPRVHLLILLIPPPYHRPSPLMIVLLLILLLPPRVPARLAVLGALVLCPLDDPLMILLSRTLTFPVACPVVPHDPALPLVRLMPVLPLA